MKASGSFSGHHTASDTLALAQGKGQFHSGSWRRPSINRTGPDDLRMHVLVIG